MGNAQSKRSSTQSDAPLNITPTSSDGTIIDTSDGGITTPPPPPTLNRISALVDPNDYLQSSPFYFGRQTSFRNGKAPTYANFNRRGSNFSSSDATTTPHNGNTNYRDPVPMTPTSRATFDQNNASYQRQHNEQSRLQHQPHFLNPADRPLTIRERQENIRLKLVEAKQQALAEKKTSKRFFQSSLSLGGGAGGVDMPVISEEGGAAPSSLSLASPERGVGAGAGTEGGEKRLSDGSTRRPLASQGTSFGSSTSRGVENEKRGGGSGSEGPEPKHRGCLGMLFGVRSS
ncbi:hypothetical protein MMC25_004848 [Agyrium rufum]|nr:hypothetical protein [Agyrium rufum]